MRPIASLLIFALLAACGRDVGIGRTTVIDPSAEIVDVMVATTRKPAARPVEFSDARAANPTYANYRISIPEDHLPGQIEWPNSNPPNPANAFATLSSRTYATQSGFVSALNQRLAPRAPQERRVFLFIHGYNYSFAEALYLTAQIHTDYEQPHVPLHFAWASAGRPSLYAYDQDSALLARDDLAELLRALLLSEAKSIEIVGHSMGAFLLMEALRQLAQADLAKLSERIGSISLISPDLDPDVFASQIKATQPLPQPLFLLTSKKDLALQFSAFLRGGSRRVGLGEKDFERFEELGVTAIDLTAFSDGQNFNHTLFNNPDLIEIALKLARDQRGPQINPGQLAQIKIDAR